jgi:Common central domain of tyrosinase
MNISRREIIKLLGLTALAPNPDSSAFANAFQSAPFSSAPVRMPLNEFVQSSKSLENLRKGIKEMKKRKPSDPLSFCYQAAIHGATKDFIKKASKADSNVPKVVKFWNQCPHNGQNSANFLPWHRGYTYHFEKILRLHTGDDGFALPYWNYMDKLYRKFPKEFGIQHLDGNINNDAKDNINPLYDAQRDFYFTSYEHEFAKGLPLLQLSDSAVDISLSLSTPVFFGKTERQGLAGGIADKEASTRGLLESYPHDQIHRAVGGIIPNGCPCACKPKHGDEPDFDAAGAMAQPPTAGFDPIFSIHHCTIDWIWTRWSCMPGKTWGTMPPDSWFNETPWIFFEPDGTSVNNPRKFYFDHRKLGIRFKYEDMNCHPLKLPPMNGNNLEAFIMPVQQLQKLAEIKNDYRVFQTRQSVIPIAFPSMIDVQSHFLAMKTGKANNFKNKKIILRFPVLDTNNTESTGFDLHLTEHPEKKFTRKDNSFIGSVSLFNHLVSKTAEMDGMDDSMDDHQDMLSQSFDVSNAIASAENINRLNLVVISYPLLVTNDTRAQILNRYSLKLSGMEFYSAT